MGSSAHRAAGVNVARMPTASRKAEKDFMNNAGVVAWQTAINGGTLRRIRLADKDEDGSMEKHG